MIRNHSVAVVLGLIISDVNFNFPCFISNHGMGFMQNFCPAVFCKFLSYGFFASSGHRVLSTFGLQDTLSRKMLKKKKKREREREKKKCHTGIVSVHTDVGNPSFFLTSSGTRVWHSMDCLPSCG